MKKPLELFVNYTAICLGIGIFVISPLEAQDLLLHYPFNDPDKGTVSVKDASAFHRDGAFVSASNMPAPLQTGNGVSGRSTDFAFDNSVNASETSGMGKLCMGGKMTAYWEGAQMFGALHSFTVTAWINLKVAWADSGTLVHIAAEQRNKRLENSVMAIAAHSSGKGKLVLSLGTDRYTFETDNCYGEVGQWFFIALTYDGTTQVDNVKLYVGTPTGKIRLVQKGSASFGIWEAAPKGKATLALGNNISMNRPFFGQIDDFRLYGDANGGAGAFGVEKLEGIRKEALSEDAHN